MVPFALRCKGAFFYFLPKKSVLYWGGACFSKKHKTFGRLKSLM